MQNCFCVPSYQNQNFTNHQFGLNPCSQSPIIGGYPETSLLWQEKSDVYVTNDLDIPVRVYFAGIGTQCGVKGLVDGMIFVCGAKDVQPGQTQHYKWEGYANTVFVKNPYASEFSGWPDVTGKKIDDMYVSELLPGGYYYHYDITSIAADVTCTVAKWAKKVPLVKKAVELITKAGC